MIPDLSSAVAVAMATFGAAAIPAAQSTCVLPAPCRITPVCRGMRAAGAAAIAATASRRCQWMEIA